MDRAEQTNGRFADSRGLSIVELPSDSGDHQVRIAGELDVSATSQLIDRLSAIAGSAVILDLSQLSFIDARGIAALLDAKARIEQQGDRLELRGARGLVARVFEICGLSHLLAE